MNIIISTVKILENKQLRFMFSLEIFAVDMQ